MWLTHLLDAGAEHTPAVAFYLRALMVCLVSRLCLIIMVRIGGWKRGRRIGFYVCVCVCVCYNTKLRNKSFNYLSGLVNNCQLLLPHEQYYRRGILKRKKYLNAYKWKMSSRPTGKCTNINQRPELTPGARASHYFLVFLTFFPLP